jgi:sec-independent protein translocase protein TatA
MLRNIGPVELLVVLAIVILVFGVGRVGELGGALGRSIREFRREVRGLGEDIPAEEEETEDTD